jgi:phage FluMu protein Com
MTIEFRCAQCNQLLRVPDTSAGKNARCPKCQTLMQIPGAAHAYVPPPPPPNFAPPPPPPPMNYGQPAQYSAPSQPGPIDFGGGSSTSTSSSGTRKKSSFDFLGGAPPASQNAPPPPPPPPPPGSGGFLVNTGGPVNPYASPSASASSYQPSGPTPKGGRQGLPWEKKPHKKGMLTAFMDTAKLVAFDPSKAFSQMLQRGDMGGPMLYSGLGMAIGILAFLLWVFLVFALLGAAGGAPAEYFGFLFLGLMFYAAILLCVSVPMSATIGNFIGAGVLHICLMICGGSKHPFDTSFRIQCYISGSLVLAMIFPPALAFVGIWQIICAIIAVHKAHEVPMGRAAMTVLLPLIVTVVFSAIMMFLMFASLAAALSQIK